MEKWRMIIALTVMVMTMAVQSFTGTEMVGLSVIKSEYSDKNQNNNIRIFYPQIQGLGDEIREEKVNVLIKEDATKLVGGYLYEDNNLFHDLDYEIKFLNDRVFSICYKGSYGGTTNGQKLSPIILTTTVDIGTGKILTINDVVNDFDALCGMLVEDRFENVTMWDGRKGERKISERYIQDEGLAGSLQKEEWDITAGTNFGWYVNGRQFVIVLNEVVTYNEFAIDISEVEDILDHGFLDMLGR